jgi:hypothetical protein
MLSALPHPSALNIAGAKSWGLIPSTLRIKTSSIHHEGRYAQAISEA